MASDAEFDSNAAWRLNPDVALRPEPFGALLYHFGTRKLSFLKNPTIVKVVKTLPQHRSARHALAAAGVTEIAPYVKALAALARSEMLVAA